MVCGQSASGMQFCTNAGWSSSLAHTSFHGKTGQGRRSSICATHRINICTTGTICPWPPPATPSASGCCPPSCVPVTAAHRLSGFASQERQLILGLDRAGLDVKLVGVLCSPSRLFPSIGGAYRSPETCRSFSAVCLHISGMCDL